jgi:phosphatidylglycerol lysyltransferase
MLTGYDFIALSYIKQKIPFLKVITNAFLSFSVTNTTGHAYVAGGSLRYLLYKKINEINIFKMIAFESITFLLGMISVLNIALILAFLTKTTFPYAHFFYIGCVIVDFILSLYIIFIIVKKKSFHIKKIQIQAPTLKQTLLQIFIGTLDISSISLVFYTLLHYHIDCNIIYCFIIFILCQLIGLSTQVPGGLGIFEGSFLYLYAHTPEQKGGIIATLLTFRILYYFIPFFISGLFFLIRTLLKK